MNWSRIWPWGSPRAKKAPLRRNPSHPPLGKGGLRGVRLAVESLEERLVLSATANDTAYELWRAQQYVVSDMSVGEAAPFVGPQAIDAQATNNSFGSLIGLPSAFSSTSYRGAGYSVAVIDTGIDYSNTDLGGGFGAGKRVVAGWDFVNNDADPMDDNGHGTHVAGIIGSSSATYSGVAPNVNLIALKVLDNNGSGTFGAVEDALKWVAANQAKYNIVSINLSLGAGNYTSNPYTFLDDEFTALRNQGVFIAVAAGNSFYSNNSAIGLDFPAVDPLVVSVGAVWTGNFGAVAWGSGARDNTTAADRIASFSQRGPALSIMAPGAIINSTYLNNTYKTMAGTSMASPVVAGAAALLHQAMDARGLTANQDSILSIMRSTAANVVDGDDENDNVTNTGLTFKRLDLGAALNALGTPANSAPVLAAIGTKSVGPGKSTIVTLSATDANNDPITYSAQIVGSSATQAFQLQQQLNLSYNGTYYLNAWGQNEKWLTGADGNWYGILPNGELRRWTGSMATTLQPANLIAIFDVAVYDDPSLLWSAQAAAAGAQPTLTIAGNQLTIQTPAGATGSFQIRVTASDGKASSQQVFTLNITNSAPFLQAIANQSLAPGKSLTLTLNATDADNDALTYSARIVSALAAQAYQFKLQLNLGYPGEYLQNYWGLNEKWMTGANGAWYCMLPNGEFRRFGGSAAATMLPSNLLATLTTAAYNDPSLLWNAQAPVAGTPTLTLIGKQLTIQAPTGVSNVFQIEVTVSDGTASAKQTFNLTLKNNAPVLAAISDKTIAPGKSTTIALSASDADNDALTYSARIVSALAAQAYQFKLQLNLGYPGDYLQNYWGLNEKWMTGANGAWYCMLPNGEFRRFGGSAAATMLPSNLLATLTTAAYNDPSLLWNAQTPVAGTPTLTLVGNQLTIQAPAGVANVFQIEVTVSDGAATAKQILNFAVKNTPPVFAALSDKTLAPGKSTTITLSASDADNDALTYSARIVSALAAQAYQFKVQLNLGYPGDYLQNYWGLNEKWMTGANGAWYCMLPNGEFRRFGGSAAATMLPSNLLATLTTTAYDDPALLWNAQAPVAGTPTLTLIGNQLTIQAPAGVSNVFQIEVSVSDGAATTKQILNLTVKNAPPVLAALNDKTLAPGKSQTITLSASDIDGDALTYSAHIDNTLAAQAYQFKLQLNLGYPGDYLQNYWGLNEKWMTGANGAWYCVLPNGEFRRFGGSAAATMLAGNLLATLPTAAYSDPSLLWNAQAPVAGTPTLTLVGNQLTIQAPAGVTNSYTIEISVSDGMATTKQQFNLTVKNTAPVLTTLSDRTLAPGGSQSITLSASDVDNDALTYSARIVSYFSAQAYQFKQQLQLSYTGTYLQNYWGLNEKWMAGPNGEWYCMLPNGEFRRFGGSAAATLQPANLLATFDSAYYADPSRLWSATPAGAQPTLTMVGNQLTISAPAGVADTFQIEVSVSDGKAVASRTFLLGVSPPPPSNSGMTGDFNADGRQDQAELRADGSLWITLANANGSVTTQFWTQWSAAADWVSVSAMDVNGDGKCDIVGLNKNGKYYVAYSTGTTFTTNVWTSALPPTAK